MKVNPSTQPLTSVRLPDVQVPSECSPGFYAMVVLDYNIIYEAYLLSSAKSSADEFAAQFACQNKSEGVPPSQWPQRMRNELIKRLVKAHRRDDHRTMAVLAHIMTDMIGSPFFIAGVTRRGTLNWARPFPMGSAAELKARVQAVLNRGSHNEAHTMKAHGVMRNVIDSPHHYANRAQVYQAEAQLQALRATVRDLRSGKAFDEVVVHGQDKGNAGPQSL